ncbi:cell division protein CrgA [Aeromicrobium sp. CF4.19]|uniref:cell division protein CrgA n=1 Tax=Aeromicrobium sp. CF4.19 TaxID=3373082 RepID=UPI003EE56E73
MAKKPSAAEQPSRFRGGWFHPLALLLLVVAIGWAVATYFATSDADFPGVGAVPGVIELGRWNYVIAAVLAFAALNVADRTRPEPPPREPGTVGNRWAAPLMIASALIGLVWIVVFYTIQQTDVDIPFYTDLGNWNIVIGMGFICAAFGFAMKWE